MNPIVSYSYSLCELLQQQWNEHVSSQNKEVSRLATDVIMRSVLMYEDESSSVDLEAKTLKVVSELPADQIQQVRDYIQHEYPDMTHVDYFSTQFSNILKLGISWSRISFLLEGKYKSDPSSDEICVMWQSLSSIGSSVEKWDKKDVFYHDRTLTRDRELYSNAFLLTPEDIHIVVEKLAKGGFKKISVAEPLCGTESDLVCVKSLRECHIDMLYREAILLKKLHELGEFVFGSQYWASPYRYNFIAPENRDPRTSVLFQEKYEPARAFLDHSTQPLTDKVWFFICIALGINALHQIRYVHGDLKLSNMVVHRSTQNPGLWMAKIIDFGLSQKEGDIGLFGAFLSPEEIDHFLKAHEKKTEKRFAQDCFTFGLCLIDCLCGVSKRTCDAWVKLERDNTDVTLKMSEIGKEFMSMEERRNFLCVYIYVRGLTEEIKGVLQEMMMSFHENLSEDQRSALNELLNIGYLLLEQNPDKRISCKQAAELLVNFRISFKTI